MEIPERRFSHLIPTAVGSAMLFMTEIGPDEAVENFCKWPKKLFHNIPSHCLGSTSSAVLYVVAAILILSGVVWTFGPSVEARLRQKKRAHADIHAAIPNGNENISLTNAVSKAIEEQQPWSIPRYPASIRTLFLRRRWLHSFFAAWPWRFPLAMRRLEFIDAWSAYFYMMDNSRPITPEDGAEKYVTTAAIHYAANSVPGTIYAGFYTPERMSQLIKAKLPNERLRLFEQQIAERKKRGGAPKITTIPTPDRFPGKNLILLSIGDFLGTFAKKRDADKDRLIKMHRRNWLLVNGIINSIPGVRGGDFGIFLFLAPLDGEPPAIVGHALSVAFDAKWAQRVALLKPGTLLTIIGQPRAIVDDMLFLHHAEIIDN